MVFVRQVLYVLALVKVVGKGFSFLVVGYEVDENIDLVDRKLHQIET